MWLWRPWVRVPLPTPHRTRSLISVRLRVHCILGCRQAVRQRTLTPSVGSNPASPARQSGDALWASPDCLVSMARDSNPRGSARTKTFLRKVFRAERSARYRGAKRRGGRTNSVRSTRSNPASPATSRRALVARRDLFSQITASRFGLPLLPPKGLRPFGDPGVRCASS